VSYIDYPGNRHGFITRLHIVHHIFGFLRLRETDSIDGV
jgi:hypothetical protein